jgi:hypothetical protein
MALISLHDLRLVSDALQSLRGAIIGGAVMRGDLRQLRLEFTDGSLAVLRIDPGVDGRPRFEVDVIRAPGEVSNQLEVRFENA